MTIKEVETRTGMTRANIRFYETEGLLSPERGENGYRDYSEEDLQLLQKIKLLRLLHMPLEEIKALQTGQSELTDALSRRINELEKQKRSLERSCQLCRTMQADGITYATLDAEWYLRSYSEPSERWLTWDTVEKVKAPWRRYFARCLDQVVYKLLWYLIVGLLLRKNVTSEAVSVLGDLAAIPMMLFLEPLFLSLLGTTPGKWIFGLSVTHDDGSRLCYADALDRTWWVLYRGYGLFIPIYSLYRLWRSYNDCVEGEELDWEEPYILVQKDEKTWRWAAWAGVSAAAVLLAVMIALLSAAPLHRGDLTVEEFAENYNHMAEYYDVDCRLLEADGSWDDRDGTVWHSDPSPSEIQWTVRDGAVQRVSFEMEIRESMWFAPMQDEMALMILSMVPAQRSYSLIQTVNKLTWPAYHSTAEGFSFTQEGVSVICEVEHSGFTVYEDVLYAEEENGYYRMVFTMELTD